MADADKQVFLWFYLLKPLCVRLDPQKDDLPSSLKGLGHTVALFFSYRFSLHRFITFRLSRNKMF